MAFHFGMDPLVAVLELDSGYQLTLGLSHGELEWRASEQNPWARDQSSLFLEGAFEEEGHYWGQSVAEVGDLKSNN
jgi:hypothetical protein